MALYKVISFRNKLLMKGAIQDSFTFIFISSIDLRITSINNYFLNINVLNSFLKLIENSIKVDHYSLRDIYSNCSCYKLFANWLLSLN